MNKFDLFLEGRKIFRVLGTLVCVLINYNNQLIFLQIKTDALKINDGANNIPKPKRVLKKMEVVKPKNDLEIDECKQQ